MHIQLFQNFRSPGIQRLMVHQTALHGQVADEQVLGHIQLRRDGQLLIHAGHAGGDGLSGGAEVDGFAVDQVVAPVALMHAGEHLDQCGLACTVLAAQGMDFALSYIERDAVQRPNAGEQLDNVFELDKRLTFTQAQAPPILFPITHFAAIMHDRVD